jgi:hypothetical protein
MNTHLRFVALIFLGLVSLRAADAPAKSAVVTDALIATVSAADDERVAATIAADRTRLEAIFSDELRYAHSNGRVDTKTSYVDSIASHRSVYTSYDYQNRTFLPAGPGVVLMFGRVVINAGTVEKINLLDLNFLAVWREENGKWRFLAWQSCRNAAPAAK